MAESGVPDALDSVTLGALTQPVLHPATGYLAFFTFVLFMIGLAMLPPPATSRPARPECRLY